MERTYGAATKLLMHNSTKTCVNVGMGTVVQWLETSPQSNAVICSNHSWGPSIWSLHVDYKLVVAQNESSEWSCVSLCCPCDRLVSRVYPTSCPMTAGIGSSLPFILYRNWTHIHLHANCVKEAYITAFKHFLRRDFLSLTFFCEQKI